MAGIFCYFTIKKVGAIGDNRTYENVDCLRVFTSVDGMTAKPINLIIIF